MPGTEVHAFNDRRRRPRCCGNCESGIAHRPRRRSDNRKSPGDLHGVPGIRADHQGGGDYIQVRQVQDLRVCHRREDRERPGGLSTGEMVIYFSMLAGTPITPISSSVFSLNVPVVFSILITAFFSCCFFQPLKSSSRPPIHTLNVAK